MALRQHIVTTDLTLTNGNNDPNDSQLGLQISIPRVDTKYLNAANCCPVSGRAAWTEFDPNNDLHGGGGLEFADVNVNATTILGWEGEATKNEHGSIVTAASAPNSELPWQKKNRDELAKLLSGEELPMKETIEFYFNDGSRGDLVKISIEPDSEVDLDSDVSEGSTALRLNRSITARDAWPPGWTATDEDAKRGSFVELPKKLDVDTVAVKDKPLKDVNHSNSHNQKRIWDTYQQNLRDHQGLKYFSLQNRAWLPNLPSARNNIWHTQNCHSPKEATLFNTSSVPETFLLSQNIPHGNIFSRKQGGYFDKMEAENLSAVYKSQYEESKMSLGSISGFVPVITRASGTNTLFSPCLVSGENNVVHPKHIPFDSPENSCAQLTILYAGTISVYDNIAADQARAIINFAGTSNSRSVNSLRSPSKQVSNTSNAMSSLSSRENLPGSNPCLLCTVSPLRTRHILPTIPTSMQNNPPTPRTLSSRDSVQHADKQQQELIKTTSSCQYAVPRALLIARKASLARFLEKRKERIKSIAPFPEKDSCQELLLQKERKLLSSNSGTVFYDETLSIPIERYLGSKHKLQDASVCEMDVQDQNWVGTAEYAERILH